MSPGSAGRQPRFDYQLRGISDNAPGYAGRVKTRYLLIISLATALVILGASAVWFLMAVT